MNWKSLKKEKIHILIFVVHKMIDLTWNYSKCQSEKEEVILMIFFLFSAVYLVPLFSFLFVITLLKAIEKIVNKRRYGKEMFWSAAFFSLVMWSISVSSSLN